jgi:peroxiredoxin Q/BCP
METKKKTVKKKSKSHLQAQSTKRKTEKLQSIAKVGKTAPSIILPDQNGVVHTLKEHNGNWLLIYFYPKDDTQGCTKEACGIRDSFPQFKKLGISVFGISADSVSRHKKFEEKYQLPFTLLSDEKKVTITKYGVWAKKKFMGREYMGILRTSFLVNPEGKIAKVYENVNPVFHAEEVLRDIVQLKLANK